MSPRIEEYVPQAPVGGPDMRRPRDANESDTGNIGNDISRLGDSAERLGNVINDRAGDAEVSQLNAQIAQAHANFSKSLDDTLMSADPNDRTIADKFMKGYDDQMDKMADTVQTAKGRKFFDQHNTQMREGFQMEAQKGQAVMAGHAAVSNLQSATDSYSASLLENPQSFEDVRSRNSDAIDQLPIAQNAKDELRGKAETQMAVSAVRGWMKTAGPDNALAQLQDKNSPWNEYLDGQQKYMLEQEAQERIRGQRTSALQAQELSDKALKKLQDANMQGMLHKLDSDTGLDLKEVYDPANKLTFEQQKVMRGMVQAKVDGSADSTNYPMLNSLYKNIMSPEGTPGKITDQMQIVNQVGKGLQISDAQKLIGLMDSKKTEAGQENSVRQKWFMEQAEKSLVKGDLGSMPDPQGPAHVAMLMNRVMRAEQEAKAAGTPLSELYDPGDNGRPPGPKSVYRYINDYRRTSMQMLEDLNKNVSSGGAMTPGLSPPAANAVSPVPQKRPGESIADYRKRTEK